MRVRLTPLLGAAVMLCPSTAHAELSREYRALLAAADVRQDDEEFLAAQPESLVVARTAERA